MKNNWSKYLLVSDLDGTLLNGHCEISKRNVLAIKEFIKMGGNFTIATGRSIEAALGYIEKLPVNFPVIVYNGGMIYDVQNSRMIWQSILSKTSKQVVKDIYKEFPMVGIEVYSEGKVIVLRKNEYVMKHEKRDKMKFYSTDEIEGDVWKMEWNKVLLTYKREEMDKIGEMLKFKYTNVRFIRSESTFIDIMPVEVSKGAALKIIADQKNIRMDNIIAVGDNMNDVEMIRSVGFGFAVKNANEKLIPHAAYMTVSNNEHALEYIVNWLKEAKQTVFTVC